MAELGRSQILVYGAIAIALLILGARWIRASDQAEEGSSGSGFAAASSGSSSEGQSGGLGDGDVVVHVAGAVERPGVYRLPASSRVADAVQRAGGASSEGSVDSINLAAALADGQQVVVPEELAGGPASATATAGAAAAETGPISLGTATLEQLDTIEGIGPVTAEQIIAFRDENGGLSSVDELDEISGIGPTTMDALRGRLQP